MTAARKRGQHSKQLSQAEISRAFEEHWSGKRRRGAPNDGRPADPDGINQGKDAPDNDS